MNVATTNIGSPEPLIYIKVPDEYREYQAVFSKIKASELPSHRKYDWYDWYYTSQRKDMASQAITVCIRLCRIDCVPHLQSFSVLLVRY